MTRDPLPQGDVAGPLQGSRRWLGAAVLVGASGQIVAALAEGSHLLGVAVVAAAVATAALLASSATPMLTSGIALLGLLGTSVAAAEGLAATLLVAVAGVSVVRLALCDWTTGTDIAPSEKTEPSSEAPVGSRIEVLSLPLVAAAQFSWIRSPGSRSSAAILCAALVVAWAHRQWPRQGDRVAGWLSRSFTAVASGLGVAMLFVTLSLVLYAPGGVIRILRRWRPRRADTPSWIDLTAHPREPDRFATRPFIEAPAPVRRRGHLAGAVSVAVLMIAGAVLWSVTHDTPPRTDTSLDVFTRARQVRFSELAAFAELHFADDLKREQDRFSNEHLVPSDVTGFESADFSGVYTNVKDGVRRTSLSTCRGCPEVTVWLLGGSAAFGLGQRDEWTIASWIVRFAASEGIRAEVVNLGVPGFTIHQEARKLAARLERGTTGRPDVVLFVHGFNDVVGTVISSTVHGIDLERPALTDTEDIIEFTSRGLDPNELGPPGRLAHVAKRKYLRERDRVEALLAPRGIASVYVFQPDALGSDSQFDAAEAPFEVDASLRSYLDAALEAVSVSLPETVNLRHLLDVGPPVFADLVHTNEVGARRVAERVTPLVLEAAERESPG